MGLLILRSSVAAGVSDPYSTSFPSDENPISEGGIWTQGGTVGGASWQNMLSEGGTAYGAGPAANFEDCIASIQGEFNTQQHFAEVTIRKDAGYTAGDTHEVEAHVGCTIAANSIATYELLIPFSGFWVCNRWNGTSGSFTLDIGTGADEISGSIQSGVVDGDVVRFCYDGTGTHPVMWVLRNSVEVWRFQDSTVGKITSGSPGIGAFARTHVNLDMKRYAISAASLGSL